MSASGDRGWTVAPTFAWFVGAITVGLILVDGDLSALANRLSPHARAVASAGPTFTAPPVTVAEVDSDADTPEPPGADTGGGGDRTAGRGSAAAGAGDPALAALDDANHTLDSFYKSLGATKGGTLGHALRVSWYGDSVIADDKIPGRLRTRLQTAFGDGGPGYVFVIPPHRFNEHHAITRSSTGGWVTHAISTTLIPDGMYGVGGSTTQSDGGTATIKLVAGKVTTADLYFLAQPGGGTASVTADGAEVIHADTAAEAKHGAYAQGTAPDGASAFKVATTGKVRLLGLDLENGTGAVVDNLGVVGANVKSFQQNDGAHVVDELAHRSADLVVIMIGANEAQWLNPGDQDTKLYQGNYEKVLAPIRKARPDGACLVVSPTDQAFEQDGAYPSRPIMPLLVDAQRKAAHAAGCAFFSTYDWMGGKGSAATWFRKGLVGSDFQHLSNKGANKLGDAVYDALTHGYQRYAAH